MASAFVSSESKNPDWFKPNRPIAVTLTCEHVIHVQMAPWREGVTFACDRNLGCGYTLGWVSWVKEGTNHHGVNSRYKK